MWCFIFISIKTNQWTIYSATTFLEKCSKMVLEKLFFKVGFFCLVNHFSRTRKNVDLWYKTTFFSGQPLFSNQISWTRFFEPDFSNHFSTLFLKWGCRINGQISILVLWDKCCFKLCNLHYISRQVYARQGGILVDLLSLRKTWQRAVKQQYLMLDRLLSAQFYVQLVNRPHFGTGILLFGPFGQSGQ